jgi:hypothetical protein
LNEPLEQATSRRTRVAWKRAKRWVPSEPDRRPRGRTIYRWLLGVLGCSYGVLLLAPWRFTLPEVGLESSWDQVVAYGAREGWQWGRDIVFTFGPLGFLTPNPYDADLLRLGLVVHGWFTLALVIAVVRLVSRASLGAAIGLYGLIMFPAAMIRGRVYTVLGLLAALLYFRRPDRAHPVLSLVLVAAAGVFALVDTSSTVVGVAIALALDASRVADRRWPPFSLVFAAAFSLAYFGIGQGAADLPAFLRSTFEIVSGYTDAMSIDGSRGELALFLTTSLLGLAIVLGVESQALRDPRRRLDALLLIGTIAIYWFVSFKHGFVRHDLHSAKAWLALGIASAGYSALRWNQSRPIVLGGSLAALSLATSCLAVLILGGQYSFASCTGYADRILIRNPTRALLEGVLAVRDPDRWATSWQEQRRAALAKIRLEQPLPSLPGTVDVIPSIQSAVLAHGLRYRPRPVFQDYAAYTPWLVKLNRAYYRSERAAQYVLIRPDTIDGRYPLLDEGITVKELLTRYDPLRLEGDLLLLGRRTQPSKSTMIDEQKESASLGEWVPIRRDGSTVFLWIDLSPNLLGDAAEIAFHPPLLWLSVRVADGTERTFRLVEGMARMGFLLTPAIETAVDFGAVAIGNPAAIPPERQVVAVRVDTGSPTGRAFFREPIGIRYASLSLDMSRIVAHDAELRVAFRRSELVTELAKRSATKAPMVEATGSELFAHAPARIALPVPSASRLHLGFGIRPGAWSDGGATDGVCFRVTAESKAGDSATLLDRCLDPVSRVEDRSVQTADLAPGLTGEGTLVFETSCRANCNWDWSYWRDIDVEPDPGTEGAQR